MSTGPPPPDPLVGFIQMLSSIMNSSTSRPEQLPAWYITIRTFMDSVMSRPAATGTTALMPLIASLMGISEADLESTMRNVLYPRSVETTARPPTPPIAQWTPETDADFAGSHPVDIVEHEEEPAQKRARHE